MSCVKIKQELVYDKLSWHLIDIWWLRDVDDSNCRLGIVDDIGEIYYFDSWALVGIAPVCMI